MMLEIMARVEGREIDLPPVVSSLTRLYTIHTSDPAAEIELENGHTVASARDVLENYGFEPDDERSKAIAYASKLLALSHTFGGRSAQALDETMFYQSTGLYDYGELTEAAASTLFPDIPNRTDTPAIFDKEIVEKMLAELKMGQAIVTLGDFLLKYIDEAQMFGEAIDG